MWVIEGGVSMWWRVRGGHVRIMLHGSGGGACQCVFEDVCWRVWEGVRKYVLESVRGV